VFGRPGSWRRWILGSILWMSLSTFAAYLSENVIVLVFAVLVDAIALLMRPYLIGDEDELHAHLRRGAVRTLTDGAEPPEDPALRTDPADWFTHGDSHRFDDAPLPPSADPDETGRSAEGV